MSNMYPEYEGKTWNPLGGECSHQCSYCYVNKLKQRMETHREKYSGKPRLWETELRGNPGTKKERDVFVCSCNDLFAADVPAALIERILRHCNAYPMNTYLFQTKNPARLIKFIRYFPKNSVFATTIETNRTTDSKAPQPMERAEAFYKFRCSSLIISQQYGWKHQITMEPLMNFSINEMMAILLRIQPNILYVGANTSAVRLPEPTEETISIFLQLIRGDPRLSIMKPILKSNLSRLTEASL